MAKRKRRKTVPNQNRQRRLVEDTEQTPEERLRETVRQLVLADGYAHFALDEKYPEGHLDTTTGLIRPREASSTKNHYELNWKDSSQRVIIATCYPRHIRCERHTRALALAYLDDDGQVIIVRGDVPFRYVGHWNFQAIDEPVE
jgi:hypothetical protein